MYIYLPYSFVSLIILDGNISIKWNEGEIKAKKGDSIFIPADYGVEICGKSQIIFSCV